MKYFTGLILTFLLLSMNISESSAKSKAQKLNKTQQVIVFLVLQNTGEVKIHQMRGADGNQVFLHQDGHREAVYSAKGKLIQDGINDGSYNFHHPAQAPLLHFAADIHPWIMMGSSRSDPTSIKERIYAYMGDLEGGIRKAQAQRSDIDALAQTLKFTQEQEAVLALWADLLATQKGDSLFSYFQLDRSMSDAETLALMKILYKRFKRTL